MVEKSKRFVYGTFHWPGDQLTPPPRPHVPLVVVTRPLTAHDQVAIEILREYGANELIGKMYYKGALNQWLPIEPRSIADVAWYTVFHKMPPAARTNTKMYYFHMEGSGRWSVLHFRTESDETGPYVAVALRYGGS